MAALQDFTVNGGSRRRTRQGVYLFAMGTTAGKTRVGGGGRQAFLSVFTVNDPRTVKNRDHERELCLKIQRDPREDESERVEVALGWS